MATLPKNGYSYTGYTEPFITPEDITSGDDLAKTGGYDTISVDGALPIEYTEFRNSVMSMTINNDVTGTTLTAGYVNFDTRGSSDVWVIDIGGTQVTVTDVTYNNVTNDYTVEVSDSVTVLSGETYRVIGRVIDVGSITSSRDYVSGEKVVEVYPPIGTYSL